MAKKRTGVTRREFLQHAALASGAMALTGLAPTATLVAQAGEQKIGAQLIGKLEGPELVLDPAKWPKKFGEAPALAELVKAGKLPPVEQRVPLEPMVIKPLIEIGKYGGTWRRALITLSRGGSDASVVLEFDLETRRFVADGFRLAEAKNRHHFNEREPAYRVEGERIVTGEAEGAPFAVLAGVGAVGHVLRHLAQVGVEDDAAVEFDADRRALDRDLLLFRGHGDLNRELHGSARIQCDGLLVDFEPGITRANRVLAGSNAGKSISAVGLGNCTLLRAVSRGRGKGVDDGIPWLADC